MNKAKLCALVGLLGFACAQADIKLDITLKEGDIVTTISEVVKDGEPMVFAREDKSFSIMAMPTGDDVCIELNLYDLEKEVEHPAIPKKVAQWGEAVEFSCEQTDCCFVIIVHQQ